MSDFYTFDESMEGSYSLHKSATKEEESFLQKSISSQLANQLPFFSIFYPDVSGNEDMQKSMSRSSVIYGNLQEDIVHHEDAILPECLENEKTPLRQAYLYRVSLYSNQSLTKQKMEEFIRDEEILQKRVRQTDKSQTYLMDKICKVTRQRNTGLWMHVFYEGGLKLTDVIAEYKGGYSEDDLYTRQLYKFVFLSLMEAAVELETETNANSCFIFDIRYLYLVPVKEKQNQKNNIIFRLKIAPQLQINRKPHDYESLSFQKQAFLIFVRLFHEKYYKHMMGDGYVIQSKLMLEEIISMFAFIPTNNSEMSKIIDQLNRNVEIDAAALKRILQVEIGEAKKFSLLPRVFTSLKDKLIKNNKKSVVEAFQKAKQTIEQCNDLSLSKTSSKNIHKRSKQNDLIVIIERNVIAMRESQVQNIETRFIEQQNDESKQLFLILPDNLIILRNSQLSKRQLILYSTANQLQKFSEMQKQLYTFGNLDDVGSCFFVMRDQNNNIVLSEKDQIKGLRKIATITIKQNHSFYLQDAVQQ